MFSKNEITTPVLFLIYNRPSLTQKVFNVIRDVQPSRLFIAADGPRGNISDDISKCEETRKIVKKIDWDCDLKTLFRDENLGCRLAVSAAIDWFFENVEEGLILEDDCLPSMSFFWFCQKLLEKYRNDERVMQICGNNFLRGRKHFQESYYFSRIPCCWGWATWRRAWKHFDLNLKYYSRFKSENQINNYHKSKEIADWHFSYLDEASKPNCRIWSSSWIYAIIVQNGLCIYPNRNLVRNMGFEDGVRKSYQTSFNIFSELPIEKLNKLSHPPFVLPDTDAENFHFDLIKQTDPRLMGMDNNTNLIEILKSIFPILKKEKITT